MGQVCQSLKRSHPHGAGYLLYFRPMGSKDKISGLIIEWANLGILCLKAHFPTLSNTIGCRYFTSGRGLGLIFRPIC